MSAITTDAPVRRTVLPLVLAGVLVALVVGVVLVLGVGSPPALASLTDVPQPVPPAPVAWAEDDESGDTCVTVARPGGGVVPAGCLLGGGELVDWTDEGLVLRTWQGVPSIVVLDPVSGDVVEQRPDTGVDGPGWDERLVVSRRDGQLVVTTVGPGAAELWRVDAPDGYQLGNAARSHDGGWVTIVDNVGRLLVVPADGSAAPRVWAQDLSSWTQIVWGPAQG